MNVLYFTWGETPRSYGVFNSQVMSQYIEIKEEFPNANFSFLSAVPIVHSGFVREGLRYRKEISIVKQKFFEKNIAFHQVPMLIPQNMIYSSGKIFDFIQNTTQHFINKKLDLAALDIVHCRSYLSAYAANKLRERHGYKYKVIFDARGFLPEEIAMKLGYEQDSKKYKFFKDIEAYLLNTSDSTITVSDTMHSAFSELGGKRLDNIYLSTDFKKLSPVEKVAKKVTKDTTITLLYLGAIGHDLWHQPNSLARVFKKIKSIYPQTKLKIITTNNHKKLKKYFSEFEVNDIYFTSTKNKEELALELNDADLALLPYRVNRNFAETHVGYSILGTKTVEYLASGIPVLCNRQCGGAAAIINEKDKFGIVYSPNDMIEITESSLSDLLSNKFKASDFEDLYSRFDYKMNSKRYSALYLEITYT